MVRIISYNVHLGRRIEKIFAWVAAQPTTDIICLQEFPEHRIVDCLSLIPHRVYGYRFAPSLHRRKNIYGELTLFRKNRVSLVSASALPLNSTKFDRLSFGRASRRSCLLTVLRIKQQKFIVANVQLSCLASNALRYRQLRHIIDTLKNKSMPHIIAGDFNVSSILGRKKLFLLMSLNSYKTPEKRLSTHRVLMVKHQLDYIFGKKCEIARVQVERLRFSDHYPISANIRLAK